MPFIKQERRATVERGTLTDVEPGDRCYKFYKEMVDAFKKEPRWTTIHKIYKGHLYDLHLTHMANVMCDDCLAARLAWQCFFNFYVLPYEEKQRALNGDI